MANTGVSHAYSCDTYTLLVNILTSNGYKSESTVNQSDIIY